MIPAGEQRARPNSKSNIGNDYCNNLEARAILRAAKASGEAVAQGTGEEEARYMRRKAEQLRMLAAREEPSIAARLLEAAAELEARADEIEQRLKLLN